MNMIKTMCLVGVVAASVCSGAAFAASKTTLQLNDPCPSFVITQSQDHSGNTGRDGHFTVTDVTDGTNIEGQLLQGDTHIHYGSPGDPLDFGQVGGGTPFRVWLAPGSNPARINDCVE